MWSYIIRRFAQGILILLLITFAIFILSREASDPMAQYSTNQRMSQEDRDRLRTSLGLDQPKPVQYVRWLGLALQGNLGKSLFSKEEVSTLIMQRLPNTLVLMFTAEIIIIAVSVALGVIAAVRQYSWVDNVITSFSFIGFSMPVFFIGLVLMYVFAVHFKKWGLPYMPTGTDIWNFWNLKELAWHLVLPVATLTIIQVAGYSRFLRSSLLEVLGQDYVRTGRAKGLAENQVLFKHALRNAILPFVTIVGLDIPFLLGGAIVTESVYSWPGMGRLFWEYAQRGDFPVVMGVLLLVSTAVVLFTIVTDVFYTVVDPRIRLS